MIKEEKVPLKEAAEPVSYTHLDVYKRQRYKQELYDLWCRQIFGNYPA